MHACYHVVDLWWGVGQTPKQLRYFLRVIPALTHYSDIVSGIPSGSIYGIIKHNMYIYIYIFWHSIWHSFWHSIWHLFRHSFQHSIWHLFWHSVWHSLWHLQVVWHSLWHGHCRTSTASARSQCAKKSRDPHLKGAPPGLCRELAWSRSNLIIPCRPPKGSQVAYNAPMFGTFWALEPCPFKEWLPNKMIHSRNHWHCGIIHTYLPSPILH